MPSIVERITAAEDQALTIKREAAVSMREAIAAANLEAQKHLSKTSENARQKYAEAEAAAQSEGKALRAEIITRQTALADEYCLEAGRRLNEAVAHILERVTEL